ncbi:unnamed protein product [Dovyalis caffra]|uniref:Phytocyanin domain-containing protein n=1 Tax=Dovyalis caffra TaxID=77055 RepID=A0AAV1S3V7_9ROSI|nr:unnamed protein product [Dovyalis caffra]
MASRIEGIVFLIFAVALLEGATAATTYKVGGDAGWIVPVNTTFYEKWAADKKFEVGDSLEFVWTSTHTAMEVTTKADYDTCVKTNGILKQTSPATFPLTKDGTYYFICTVGPHCSLGQKVTIVVGNGNSSSPSPSMPKNHAAFSAVLSTTTIAAANYTPKTLVDRHKKMASRLCFNIGFLIVGLLGLLVHGANAANKCIVGGDLG